MRTKSKLKGENTARPGRPERDPVEFFRTTFWARSVCVAANASARELEPALGKDGHWLGVWSRYERGLVSPSRKRLIRIDKKLPNTGRYYFCPLWGLLRDFAFTQNDLRDAVMWLKPLFRRAFINDGPSSTGLFWRNKVNPIGTLDAACRLLKDSEYGLDALTTILLILREAEVMQDAWAYLQAIQAWGDVELLKSAHPVLRHFPTVLIESVLEPLLDMRFAEAEIDTLWTRHLETYRAKRPVIFPLRSKIYILDAVHTFGLDEQDS